MVRGLKYLTKKAFILLSTLCVHCTCMYAFISPSLVASLELVGNITINGFQKINLLSSLFLSSFLVHNNDDNKWTQAAPCSIDCCDVCTLYKYQLDFSSQFPHHHLVNSKWKQSSQQRYYIGLTNLTVIVFLCSRVYVPTERAHILMKISACVFALCCLQAHFFIVLLFVLKYFERIWYASIHKYTRSSSLLKSKKKKCIKQTWTRNATIKERSEFRSCVCVCVRACVAGVAL